MHAKRKHPCARFGASQSSLLEDLAQPRMHPKPTTPTNWIAAPPRGGKQQRLPQTLTTQKTKFLKFSKPTHNFRTQH